MTTVGFIGSGQIGGAIARLAIEAGHQVMLSNLRGVVTQRDITAVIDAMEQAGRAPLTIKTHWSALKPFFGWLVEEDVLTVSPIARASVSADAVLHRVRDIVVPDFRFIDMLSDGLGVGQDRLILRAPVGDRGSVRGGGNDGRGCRLVGQAVRRPVVEVEGRLVRKPTPKGGRSRAVGLHMLHQGPPCRPLPDCGRPPGDTRRLHL